MWSTCDFWGGITVCFVWNTCLPFDLVFTYHGQHGRSLRHSDDTSRQFVGVARLAAHESQPCRQLPDPLGVVMAHELLNISISHTWACVAPVYRKIKIGLSKAGQLAAISHYASAKQAPALVIIAILGQ
jgi:hypothetical protein